MKTALTLRCALLMMVILVFALIQLPANADSIVAPTAPQAVVVSPKASSLDVSWNINMEADLAGYRVYWGTTSQFYSKNQDVGYNASFEITGLTAGTTYYVAVKAYDSYSNYSQYSAEKTGVPQLALPDIPPAAIIDTITPANGNDGENFTFTGHGIDTDGDSIIGWEWRSSIDGLLGNTAVASHALSTGYHTIFFKVRDSRGAFSETKTKIVIVNGIPTATIESIAPNPAFFTDTVTFTGSGTDDGSITGYEWKDGSSVISSSDSFTKNDLSVGAHTISLRVKDNNGVWSSPVSTSVLINNPPKPDPPVISKPLNGSKTRGSTTNVSGTAATDCTIKVYVNGTEAANKATGTSTTWSITGVPVIEGTNDIYATAVNKYDVTSDRSNTVRITRDSTAPPMPIITGPEPGTYYSNLIKIEGTSEALTGISIYDGVEFAGYAMAGADGKWSAEISFTTYGTHEITATATDDYENTSQHSASLTLIFSAVLPAIKSVSPSDNGVCGGSNQRIQVQFEESAGIDQASIQMWFDGAQCTPVTSPNSALYIAPNITEASHTAKVSVRDKAGNLAEKTWTFKVLRGDIDGSGTVNIFDIVIVGRAFGTSPGSVGWNEKADPDANNTVNIFDIVLVGKNFGRTIT